MALSKIANRMVHAYQRSFEVLRKGGALASIIEPADAGLAERLGMRAGYTFVDPNGEQQMPWA